MRLTNSRYCLIITAIILICSIIWSCTPAASIGGKVEKDKLKDGLYEGKFKHGPVSASVKVTIKNQKITDIEIIEHDTFKGKKAEPVVPKRIIENQSTNVEVVTGATHSSRVIMNAVQNALVKSYSDTLK
jgi:uncharacterized protein with FMN-binding domain